MDYNKLIKNLDNIMKTLDNEKTPIKVEVDRIYEISLYNKVLQIDKNKVIYR